MSCLSIILVICGIIAYSGYKNGTYNPFNKQKTMTELTFSIIKPGAVARNTAGQINAQLESAGFKIVAQRMTKLTKEQAEGFYAVHSERPFYAKLVEVMTSGPVVLQVLKRENAVEEYRKVLGATNPADAEEGTIRAKYGKELDDNAAHGSDSIENAKTEIAFFFAEDEIFA